MRITIVSFLMLLGLAALYSWTQDLPLPLPVLILAGVGLAIGSNTNKRLGILGKPQPVKIPANPLKAEPPPLTPAPAKLSRSSNPTANAPQLPNLQPPKPATRSISFEIRPPQT